MAPRCRTWQRAIGCCPTCGRAQTRLRALIDNEPECVKLLDAQGRLLEMNAAGLRMIEADSADAVIGQCV